MPAEVVTALIAVAGVCIGATLSYFATSRLDRRRFERERAAAREDEERKIERDRSSFQREALESLQGAMSSGFHAASAMWRARSEGRSPSAQDVAAVQAARHVFSASAPRLTDQFLIMFITAAFDKIAACAFGWDAADNEFDRDRLYGAMFAGANFANHRIGEALRNLVYSDQPNVGPRVLSDLDEAIALREDPDRLEAHNLGTAAQFQALWRARADAEAQIARGIRPE